MITKLQYLRNNPLFLVGALWPLVLLAPHIPGIPRPVVDGLPWRQELFVMGLLGLGLFLLFKSRTSLSSDLTSRFKIPFFLGLLFVTWIGFSSAWANDKYAAVHMALEWSAYLLFFGLMALAPARVIRASIVTLTVVVTILGVSSLIEAWLGAPLTDGNLRVGVKPILRGSGTFGELMGTVAVLFTSFALITRHQRNAICLGAVAVLSWLGTLQSLERAPFIATSIALTILLLSSLVGKASKQRVAILTAALLIAVLVQMVPMKQTSEGHISTVGRIKTAAEGDLNSQARFLLWGIAFEMLTAHPVIGVGGGNYQANYAEGRAQFASENPGSALVSLNEHLLPIYAHNEYVQLLAELGLVGFGLFLLFAGSLVLTAVRGWFVVRRKLAVIGPAAAMLAFAVSSGASASSFRYLSGGMVFFFAAALIVRSVSSSRILVESDTRPARTDSPFRFVRLGFSGLVLIGIVAFSLQATGLTLLAQAEASTSNGEREKYYRESLRFYPSNLSGHFSYGMWLYGQHRAQEALPYLQFSVDHGLTNSICFQYLASVQDNAGYLAEAEKTLQRSVRVYPRSVFLLVRHSVALDRLGRKDEADQEFSRGLMIDGPEARGWRNLIVEDIDSALAAAKTDSSVVGPSDLGPQAAVLAVLQENEFKNPELANSGWRQRMRSAESSLKQ